MPETPPHPSSSRKLGGIPEGDAVSLEIYRKPRVFQMSPIPRPAPPQNPPARKPSKGPKIFWLLVFLLLVGGGGYLYLAPPPQVVAWWENWTAPRPTPVYTGVAPADSTPLADATAGWMWLFDDREWRVPSAAENIYQEGLVRLRNRMEKPQPAPNAVIRARLYLRDGKNTGGVFLRSTPEGGRYRLFMDADARHVRLVHDGAEATTELGKYRFVKPRERGDQVLLELRVEGDKLTASVNGAIVIEAEDARSKEAGTWGIEAGDGWFGLVEVPVPDPVKMAVAATPAPEPEPTMPAAPTPATPPPLSETGKWLAGVDPQWQAAFQREVADPFQAGVEALKKQYLAGIDSQLAFATQAAKPDDAAAFRGESQRIGGGEDVPATDDAIVPPALKQLRTRYRSDFARLDQARFEKSKALHARTDALLAKNQAALAQNQRPQEAEELKAKREQLAALWLKPPAAAAMVAAVPPVVRPPLGSPATGTSFAKMPPRDVVEKLLAAGAAVWVSDKAGRRTEIKTLPQLTADKFEIVRVDFTRLAADGETLTTEDLAIVEALGDVVELALRGPAVTDAVMEKLRPFRNLSQLTIDGARITSASYPILPTLSALRELQLRGVGTGDEAMKIIGQCRRLQRLSLANLPFGDEGLLPIGKLSGLEELELNDISKLTSVGIGHLAAASSLRRLNLNGLRISSPVLDAVARCSGLEYLSLAGNPLKDEQIAGLSGLPRLRGLNLNNTGVIGTVFAGWSTRTALVTLNLMGEPGVNDAALKAIASTFPRLETLEITGVPLGATEAGFAAVGRLRSLRTLRVGGGVVNDEIAAEIAKCDDLTNLLVPAARLTEPGVVALSKLPRLATLQIDQPPVSEAALKSFAKCRALRSIQLGESTPPETEQKLRAALAGVTILK